MVTIWYAQNMSSRQRHGPAPPRPSRIMGSLSLREARFVRFYVGESRGNGRHASRLAGYSGSVKVLDVQAARLLGRPRVREAVQQALEAEVARRGFCRDSLVQEICKVLAEDRPFERLKAAELLAKLMGWLRPTDRTTRNRPLQEGSASYAALVETLRYSEDRFTPQEREALRDELLRITTEATKVVELLDNHGGN